MPGARAASLAALSAALRRLHARCIADNTDHNYSYSSSSRSSSSGNCSTTSHKNSAIITAAPAASVPDAATDAHTDQSSPAAVTTTTVAEAGLPPSGSCRQARARKLALARGAAAFRRKPRDGLKLLEAEGVFVLPGGRLDSREVAAFLRTAPGLDKASVGCYLGEAGISGSGGCGTPGGLSSVAAADAANYVDFDEEADTAQGSSVSRDTERCVVVGGGRGGSGGVYRGDTAEFHAEVLEAFVNSFDFRGQGLLASLRMFLEAFRLPGEAQQIDRILHVSEGRSFCTLLMCFVCFVCAFVFVGSVGCLRRFVCGDDVTAKTHRVMEVSR